MKKSIGILLCVLLIFSISSCSFLSYTIADAMKLEQVCDKGTLDTWYKGTCDEQYLTMVDSTPEETAQYFEESLLMEADYFAYYWTLYIEELGESFDSLSEELQTEVIELCREMYKHIKYEVVSSAKVEEDSYAVKVLVYPVNLLGLANDSYIANGYKPLDDFYAEYENVSFEEMTDEEYFEYCERSAELTLQMIKEHLPNIGNMDAVSIMVQVDIIDGLYTINEDDLSEIDWNIIYYP